MNKIHDRTVGKALAVLVLVLGLHGCGSDGADTATDRDDLAPPVLPGIEGSGVISARITGPIDRFGSVYVNGVRYTTDAALIVGDAAAVDESQLRAGQIITLEVRRAADGSLATATRVELSNTVVGCIESIDAAARSFVVAGQTVRTDAATLYGTELERGFDGALGDGLAVAISGHRDVAGEVRATRVDQHAGCARVQVVGVPDAVDTAQARFVIGALVVDYSRVLTMQIPAEDLAGGPEVAVSGRLRDSTLVAESIRVAEPAVDGIDQFEVAGRVTGMPSGTELELGATRATLNAATQFVGERPSVDDLVLVTGSVTGGELVAKRVERIVEPEHRVSGRIASVASDGSFAMFGIAVQTDLRTRFEDRSALAERRFSTASLRAGDLVSVRGAPGDQPGSLRAAVIIRADFGDDDDDDDDDDDAGDDGRDDGQAGSGESVSIRSSVQAADDSSVTLLGQRILVEGGIDLDDDSSEELLGRFVLIEGRYRDGVIVAREAQVDGDDDLDE